MYFVTDIVMLCPLLGHVFFGCVKTNSSCTKPIGSAGTSHGLVAHLVLHLPLEQWDPLRLELGLTETDLGSSGMLFVCRNGQF